LVGTGTSRRARKELKLPLSISLVGNSSLGNSSLLLGNGACGQRDSMGRSCVTRRESMRRSCVMPGGSRCRNVYVWRRYHAWRGRANPSAGDREANRNSHNLRSTAHDSPSS
jgi:hypothetical protein